MAAALGARVRAAAEGGESEEWDLASCPGALGELVAAAFGPGPLASAEPVRVSFRVGGGKKTRLKYDPALPKDLMGLLAGAGFADDRGASACVECQGSFKYQHDTDKDLKFIHVFPFLSLPPAADGDGGGGAGGAGGGGGGAPAGEDLAEATCRTCSVAELKALAPEKLATFTQKRGAVRWLKGMAKELVALEEAMADPRSGGLSEAQQERYDSTVELPEKIEWLEAEMEAMLERGQLGKTERGDFLGELEERMQALQVSGEEARAGGKAKRAAKLDEAAEKVEAKAAAVRAIQPVELKAKHGKEMAALRKELKEIAKLEGSKQLQNVAALRRIGEREGLEERLAELWAESRGWFNTLPAGAMREGAPAGPKAAKAGGSAGPAPGDGFTAAGGGKRGGKGKVNSSRSKAKSANPFDLLS